MAILTPNYWTEEKYQPLTETETAYGNRVKIPDSMMDIWQSYQLRGGKVIAKVRRWSAEGRYKGDELRRYEDLWKVYMEHYRHPTIETPSYWKKEERYLPLTEGKTAYGNRVMIPSAENMVYVWKLWERSKHLILPRIEEAKAAGWFDRTVSGWIMQDLKSVYFEVYREKDRVIKIRWEER